MSCMCKVADDITEGSRPRITAYLESEGAPVTNGAVVVKVRKPSKDEDTYVPVNDGDGWYHVDITVDQPGQWKFQWFNAETGALKEGSFQVRSSIFT